MARATRKKDLIETLTEPTTRATADIYLDRDSGQFWTVIGDERLRGSSLTQLRDDANRRLRETASLTWQKIIRVDTTPKGSSFGMQMHPDGKPWVALNFSIHTVAKRPDGTWVEDQRALFDFTRPVLKPWYSESGKKDIPYTDAALATLTRLQDAIVEAHRKLAWLLSQADVGQALQRLGANVQALLPESTEGDRRRLTCQHSEISWTPSPTS